jgi:hypothetical protein
MANNLIRRNVMIDRETFKILCQFQDELHLGKRGFSRALNTAVQDWNEARQTVGAPLIAPALERRAEAV